MPISIDNRKNSQSKRKGFLIIFSTRGLVFTCYPQFKMLKDECINKFMSLVEFFPIRAKFLLNEDKPFVSIPLWIKWFDFVGATIYTKKNKLITSHIIQFQHETQLKEGRWPEQNSPQSVLLLELLSQAEELSSEHQSFRRSGKRSALAYTIQSCLGPARVSAWTSYPVQFRPVHYA